VLGGGLELERKASYVGSNQRHSERVRSRSILYPPFSKSPDAMLVSSHVLLYGGAAETLTLTVREDYNE